MDFSPIRWNDDIVEMIDQRILPGTERWNQYTTWPEVADAIVTMVIRGAPAIGIATAMGIALAFRGFEGDSAAIQAKMDEVCEGINVRPTAVNLGWAIAEYKKLFAANKGLSGKELFELFQRESQLLLEKDIADNKAMGAFSLPFVPDGARILTHCNAGALATGGYGTALGVIRAAHEAGKNISVFADETRPFLQGARLTAWELMRDGIDTTVLSDSTAGHLMKTGQIDLVVVGSDRIAANGDVANKIGTYMVSVLAKEHSVPFYVAAPLSTIDRNCPSGDEIPIENRTPREVTHVLDKIQIVPDNTKVLNIAFDVTPAKNVAALFTEVGVAKPPSNETIRNLFEMK
jgi:methylthioribose-1-phosphate isomerase